MTDNIRTAQDGEITNITIDSPDDGNRVSDEMAAHLADLMQQASEGSKAIVLRTAGEDFCLGRKTMGRTWPQPEALESREKMSVVFDFYDTFRRIGIPVIAPIQGRASGFGCAIAALTDITIAARSARFELPETSHRIMPTAAMSSMVDRVSRKGLLYLSYSAQSIDAANALAIGLVGEVVADDEVEAALGRVVENIRRMPWPAVYTIKAFASNAIGMSINGVNDYAQNLHATVNTSSRMRE